MEFTHVPVLPEETIASLCIKPDGIYVDGTAGGGGHSSMIAAQLTTGRLIAIDQDPDALEWEESIKGIPVRCIGDGELIHEAYFDVDNGHYSITFDCAEEGLGLTAEDLAEILAGML